MSYTKKQFRTSGGPASSLAGCLATGWNRFALQRQVCVLCMLRHISCSSFLSGKQLNANAWSLADCSKTLSLTLLPQIPRISGIVSRTAQLAKSEGLLYRIADCPAALTSHHFSTLMEHVVPSPRVNFQSMERYMGRSVLLVCKVSGLVK